MNMRNVAIIAHVDHGKTTLVSQLLKFSGTYRDASSLSNDFVDSNPIERERGITILAKTTALDYKGVKIHILDTPGHADFGGEVERIMHMVDGCILVVDAFEGTMPQTRFVLKKALQSHVKPIVVINKIDRPNANPKKVVDDVLALFIELGAPEEFLDFKVAYTSALKGTSSLSADPDDQVPGMAAVLDLIISEISEPQVEPDKPFQFQPALLDYNDFIGRIGIGLVKRGSVKLNDIITDIRLDGSFKQFKVLKIFGYSGINRIEIDHAEAGDIIGIAGLTDINVGETLCDNNNLDALPILRIDEPTLQMTFGTNSSPLAGRDGKFLTARKIEERLNREVQKDVSLRVKRIENAEQWIVSGRGELHLGILIENMRREGYELEVSKPEVIIKTINGVKCEPYEDLSIDIPNDFTGTIMDVLGNRSADLVKMESEETTTKLDYVIPSRGLIGFISNFLTLTKGYGIISHTYKEYRPMIKANVGERQVGVLVSVDQGTSTPYAIEHVEDRGILFIEPKVDVYEGMIVGENKYDIDLAVNVTQTKPQTNVRSSNKDFTVVLKSARKMSLEACLDYINRDELVEITPTTYRMRKKVLNTAERKKYDYKKRNGLVD